MGAIWRTYKNETDTIQHFIDANGAPVTAEIGETVTYLVEREIPYSENGGSEMSTLPIGMSTPPIGMQRIYNLYRNPKTGKVEIEFTDSPRE